MDDGLRDVLVLLEAVLEVGGRDVLAARGDDDVLLAAGDVEEAVLVDAADVAGVQPAVDDRLARWPPRSCSSRGRCSARARGSRRRRRSSPPRRGRACRPSRSGSPPAVLHVAAVEVSVMPQPSSTGTPQA